MVDDVAPKTKRKKKKPRVAGAAPATAVPVSARAAAAKKRSAPAADWSPAAEQRRNIVRVALAIVAIVYLATVWLDGIGVPVWKALGRPWTYFGQVSALFPKESPVVIDYRAEGWSCEDHAWREIDVRPYFPLDAENKENRFQRAIQFYRRNRTVMRALEDFVMRRYDASSDHAPIAGVRFLSLRIPYPAPGEHVDPVQRKPIASYPESQRHAWYYTPGSRRAERCGYPPRERVDDDAPKTFGPVTPPAADEAE